MVTPDVLNAAILRKFKAPLGKVSGRFRSAAGRFVLSQCQFVPRKVILFHSATVIVNEVYRVPQAA